MKKEYNKPELELINFDEEIMTLEAESTFDDAWDSPEANPELLS